MNLPDERQALVEPRDRDDVLTSSPSDVRSSIHRTPLVAFFACFGMTAAAASSVFVFAHILCRDPAACDSDELGAFSGSLAFATTLANVCAIVAIQPLYAISKQRPKAVLLVWVACRGSSVVVLWIASSLKSIRVVILSKVLEGTATDNILQFALSIIYVRAKDGVELSSLMAESMACTLLGSALGPLAAGLAQNLQQRLLMSLIALSTAAVYGMVVVHIGPHPSSVRETCGEETHETSDETRESYDSRKTSLVKRAIQRWCFHVHVLLIEPMLIPPGLALLFYTTGQGYVLPALMVYASGRFGFTDRQNSWLLSLAVIISASYALLFKVFQQKMKTRWSLSSQPLLNTVAAAVGMVALGGSLPLVLKISSANQIYLVVSLMSLGITSSSFIKAVTFLQLESPHIATGAVAILESTGSLLSPIALGLAQNKLPGGYWTLVSTISMMIALVLLVVPFLGPGKWHWHADRTTRV